MTHTDWQVCCLEFSALRVSHDSSKLTADDVELVEPPSWKGLFGGVEGWSGGSGLDSEIYG